MTNTPKNFALQLGALLTLYASITSLTTVLFGVISAALPDAADSYYRVENATQTIRFGIAMLIVVFPIYLWLTRTVNQIRRNEDGVYLALTKWLIYLSLLVGGAILIGDFIATINAFLNGELTTRFLLKAGILAFVIGISFYYYLKDAQGYWQTHEKGSIRFGVGALVLVIASLVLGFYHSETPAEVRETKIDDRQITELSSIQWRTEDYYRLNESLPSSIDELYEGIVAPTAPEGRAPYVYSVTGTTTYQLCATFTYDSSASTYTQPTDMLKSNSNWSHGEGEWCFDRTVENDDR